MKNLLKIYNPIKLNLLYKYRNLSYKIHKVSYYKFYCKCNINKEFLEFIDFIEHIRISHNIKDINLDLLNKIIPNYNKKKFGVKFYWGLHCTCGNSFTSSLCNADLIIKDGKITLLRLYKLYCIKCKKIADFKYKNILDKYLEERVLQKLIYKQYKDVFSKYDQNKDYKELLEGHKPELCEKCRLSKSGHC